MTFYEQICSTTASAAGTFQPREELLQAIKDAAANGEHQAAFDATMQERTWLRTQGFDVSFKRDLLRGVPTYEVSWLPKPQNVRRSERDMDPPFGRNWLANPRTGQD